MAKKDVTVVLLVAEIDGKLDFGQIMAKLDAFRERAQVSALHGISLYRASNQLARQFDLGGAARTVPARHITVDTEE